MFAATWILLSDGFLAVLAPDRGTLVRWSQYKGLAFVAITSGFLFILIHRTLAGLERGQAALLRAERDEHLTTAMFDSVPGVLYLFDEAGRFLRWNKAFQRVTGYGEDEIVAMHPLDFFPVEIRPLMQERIAEVFTTGSSTATAPLRTKDERRIHHFFTGHRIEFAGRPCVIGVGIDLTDQEATRERLAQSDLLLRIAGRTARLGGWTITLPERILAWSDEVRAMHDLPAGYVPSLQEGIDLYVPQHREIIKRHMAACEREGISYDLELEKVTARGRRFWVRTIGSAVRDADGRIVGLQGSFQDITIRKGADARLREQAQLLDKAQDAIVVRGLDHRVRYWNKSAERLYGWTAAEGIGRTVTELIGHDPAAFEAASAALLAKGEWTGEVDHRTKEGSLVTVEGRWTLVRDDHGGPTSILSIETDITQRKTLERQFVRAQRMESIGTLAGGMAHDLNNVLTPILMSIDLLKHSVTDEEGRDTLELIGASARRGAELVRQVLSFARGVEGRRVAVHLDQVVRDTAGILRDSLPKNIQLLERVAADLRPLDADPTQLQQVLLNLCVNARDALPAGGTIGITAENVTIDQLHAAMNLEAEVGPYVKIEVDDNGTGIPREIIDRIFDPFFTTKETGKGTGLGLATTLAIVKAHGGFLRVESKPGMGTRFRIYLPVRAGVSPKAGEAAPTSAPR